MKNFILSTAEYNNLLVRRKVKVVSSEILNTLISDLKKDTTALQETLIALEKFMEEQPNLRKTIEKDFIKIEKSLLDIKNIARKLASLKVKTKRRESNV